MHSPLATALARIRAHASLQVAGGTRRGWKRRVARTCRTRRRSRRGTASRTISKRCGSCSHTSTASSCRSGQTDPLEILPRVTPAVHHGWRWNWARLHAHKALWPAAAHLRALLVLVAFQVTRFGTLIAHAAVVTLISDAKPRPLVLPCPRHPNHAVVGRLHHRVPH